MKILKKYILLIAFVVNTLNLFSQNDGEPIYTINNNEICTNNLFITNPTAKISNLEYSTACLYKTKVGETVYIVKMSRFKGWENDPGDFDVIEFYKKGTKALTFKNEDCIVKLNNPRNLYTSRLKQFSSNNYFFERELTPDSKAIIFLGQHYGTDLPDLIIFIATPNQIKLAYCKKMSIKSFVSDPDSFSLLIQSNINEEGEPAITHTIREKDGVLWFYK